VGVGWAQSFWSKDGGVTWYGWDGAVTNDWIVVDPTSPTDRANYGFRFNLTYSYSVLQHLSGAVWVNMLLSEWTTWVAGGTSLLAYNYLRTTNNLQGVWLYGMRFDYAGPGYDTAFEVGGLISIYGGGPQVQVKRITDTTFDVKNNLGVNILDLRLRVYTAD
jgi:hypothetical protein